ncbi:hypothetical protein [Photobacterium damselae]|uniref:hypothetical protein n=1 Tax=Photobacterium damselae TaxID=38293 RepID=UPI001F376DA5|nr:hypothetical protein [Photobacterium damselae]UKA04898.1 hypothetical protein IHC89_21885 [Photobacterium damselae subsp. damselae]
MNVSEFFNFQATPFTDLETSNNHFEGWDIFENSDYGFEIEKADDTTAFKSDSDAVLFVINNAISGIFTHLKALLFIKYYSPIVFNSYVEFAKAEQATDDLGDCIDQFEAQMLSMITSINKK